MSVFQDVTAVPFLVVIPVLGMSDGADLLVSSLGWAAAKAALAFALVFFAGRWLLRPLFRLVTKRRSAELFTLAVLLVALLAAWTTNNLGLSLAFGAFLAGMMLGETEFRHQIESTVRPFRDVLLGLFFVGIGMLIDPASIPRVWQWAALGALLLLVSKALLVTALVRRSGISAMTAWQTGLLLAVGGEFGFALLAIALDAQVIGVELGQIVLTSVLFSMIAGALLIRFNQTIARRLVSIRRNAEPEVPNMAIDESNPPVLIGGYGRVGHTIAVLLQNSGIPCVAFDVDPKRVAQGRADGNQVLYGDISDPELMVAIHVERTPLVILTVDDSVIALRTVAFLRSIAPHVPIVVRARDLAATSQLLAAGATHAYPEAIEASLRLGATAMKILCVPDNDIELIVQGVRDWDYQPVLEDEHVQ